MSSFWLLTAGLVGSALLILLVLPRLWVRPLEGESTLDWLSLRKRELALEGESLSDDAEVRVFDELSDAPQTPTVGRALPSGVYWALPLLIGAFALLLYRQVGALDDVAISDRLANLESATPEDLTALVDAIEDRLIQRPENIDYLALLGEFYSGSGQFERAADIYDRLATLLPQNAEVLARAAQAAFMRDGRQLSPVSKARAEAALAIDPTQRAALGTLGMASFESGDFSAAVSYWERLLALETPGTPGHEMMSNILAEARSKADASADGEAGERAASAVGSTLESADPVAAEANATVGVEVLVSLPDSLVVEPRATVFVLARPAGSQQRMPLAVVRRSAAELPLRVRLSDANSMAGQTLSSVPAVDIEVQVSPSGQPGLANAALVGSAAGVAPSGDASVEVILAPTAR